MSELLVLDFDGVVCDSIKECFVSSWIAYHGLERGSGDTAVPSEMPIGFSRLRPFIRTGADFLFIQEILATGAEVIDQRAFDELTRAAGEPKRARYHELYYRARTALLERDRASWLAMNRIYPHIAEGFALMGPATLPFILSTKKPRFIAEILAAARIEMPAERILWSDAEPKLVTVERLRRDGGCERACFVEDQLDHIRENTNPRIDVFLATWGYVREEWLVQPSSVPLLTPSGFLALVARSFTGAAGSPSTRRAASRRPEP
jgi:phosphoglycolate phosphatase-like HAD superfamily hydrolase